MRNLAVLTVSQSRCMAILHLRLTVFFQPVFFQKLCIWQKYEPSVLFTLPGSSALNLIRF